MCGIFAYLNYGVPRDRRYILEALYKGLRRLEYRGYDSAGLAIDSAGPHELITFLPNLPPQADGAPSRPIIFKAEGKIDALVENVMARPDPALAFLVSNTAH
jgi:glucosamine--fructose-6-phosphate aminotransferase (isomerizing)